MRVGRAGPVVGHSGTSQEALSGLAQKQGQQGLRGGTWVNDFLRNRMAWIW